jgi:NDP-sugar pyrophosphorylase family protein
MLAAHRLRDAAVSIALHHVDDARAFGLVETDAEARVTAFREKPTDLVPGEVNAGTYLIDPVVLAPWTSDRAISIEREIFPAVIGAGHHVSGFLAEAYWIDVGTPEKYLQAHFDLLAGRVAGVEYPAPWVHPTADVDLRSRLGRWVALGAESRIGPDAPESRRAPRSSAASSEPAPGWRPSSRSRIGRSAATKRSRDLVRPASAMRAAVPPEVGPTADSSGGRPRTMC